MRIQSHYKYIAIAGHILLFIQRYTFSIWRQKKVQSVHFQSTECDQQKQKFAMSQKRAFRCCQAVFDSQRKRNIVAQPLDIG